MLNGVPRNEVVSNLRKVVLLSPAAPKKVPSDNQSGEQVRHSSQMAHYALWPCDQPICQPVHPCRPHDPLGIPAGRTSPDPYLHPRHCRRSSPMSLIRRSHSITQQFVWRAPKITAGVKPVSAESAHLRVLSVRGRYAAWWCSTSSPGKLTLCKPPSAIQARVLRRARTNSSLPRE
jgi:hypothetical protein